MGHTAVRPPEPETDVCCYFDLLDSEALAKQPIPGCSRATSSLLSNIWEIRLTKKIPPLISALMPPRKRPREDDDENIKASAEPGCERGEPWFDDGNVILIVENTAFRVYKSILSCNSGISCDTFTVPQPVDAEMWNGCPVVHLSDTRKDLVRVLSALFESKNMCVYH